MKLLSQAFPDIGKMRVIDLGGTVEWWLRSLLRPAPVTVVNLFEPGVTEERWFSRSPATPAMRARCCLQSAFPPVTI